MTERHEPALELLLASYPFLRFARGEKREFLREAWMRTAHDVAGRRLGNEGRLPTNPRDAAIALHHATVELAESIGISAADLKDAWNDRCVPRVTDTGLAIERVIALISVFIAREMSRP